MALRYLILIGSAQAVQPLVERCAACTELRPVMTGRRFTVLTAGEGDAICNPLSATTVIGHLFSTIHMSRVKQLDDAMAGRIRQSRGGELVESYWGGYVSVFESPDSSRTHIVRDPVGTAPCYYLKAEGIWVVASDLEALRQARLSTPAIDWGSVGRHLLQPDLRTSETCLTEVVELPGGHRLTLGPGEADVDQLWSPGRFVSPREQISDRAEAVERLRRTTLNCIHAWASCYDELLVQISGGLDSSIVAAGLRKAAAHISCLTIATVQPEGDERGYARAVADHLGLSLREAFFDPSQVDVTHSDGSHLPRPTARCYGQEIDRISLQAAQDAGAQAVFTGNSGDGTFCFLQSVSPVVDRLLTEGLGVGSWRTVEDVVRLTGCSVWTILRLVAGRLLGGRRPYRWRVDTRLLSAEVAAQQRDPREHPWLPPSNRILPGRAAHIARLVQAHYHQEAFPRGRDIPMISPLSSQPLVELCLRIPTWMWCSGGINRAIARAAFAPDLPAAVLERRSKGGPDGLLVDILERNRGTLVDFLGEGLLAQNRIVDAEQIRARLARSGPTVGEDYIRLLDLADAEAWARAWDG
ncbi:asparagine synthase-related protein [Flavisphingomonas formosensis]|uniref:asparagine synthase-related protein n=1 Tax=Flavisphingomonas formosensis TaxID=861534 RepID=UPI0012FA36D0|nr:asparagine synthase-related protein [Sphingomonas formosensis]